MADPLDLLERIEAQLSNCRTCYDMRDHDHLCKGCSDNVLELLKEAAKTLASRQEVEHGAVVGGVEGSSRDPRADRDAGANDDARTIVASRQEACGYCGMIPHRDGVHFYAPTGASRQEAQPQADWIKMARCSHANAAGGNDYILCNDCGLMWDYRKETANDGLVNFIKLNPLPASPREEAPQENGASLASIPEGYRVQPDNDGAGDWHIITFKDGHRVQIYTNHPLVIVDAEAH